MTKSTKVNPRIVRLLERVAQYPNIPRKKSKFEVSYTIVVSKRRVEEPVFVL